MLVTEIYLVICLAVVLQLAITWSLAYIFRYSDLNDYFFDHFKNISVFDRKKKQFTASNFVP